MGREKSCAVNAPNVIVVLVDDMGFSDIGCYGGEIETPHLDELAREGVRFSNFYNTARCSPSRASLLTGLHPHQTGIGVLTGDHRPSGYPGDLSDDVPTVAEMLRSEGYMTGMVGKWHLSADLWDATSSWPTRRGFEYFYGTITGTGSYFQPGTLMRGETNVEEEAQDPDYYYTSAISSEAEAFIDRAHEGDKPFFLYVAYTAPHWPLHAPAEAVDRYRGRFDEGWDVLRQKRFERQIELGIVDGDARLSARDPFNEPWDEVSDKEWEARRMEVYAAQVSEMDRGVGAIMSSLREHGMDENTIVFFLSDNGASAEELPHQNPAVFVERKDLYRKHTRAGEPVHLGNEPAIVPGPESTYASYGRRWANLSNTPYRRYKKWVHEGGIAAPLIVRWPAAGLDRGGMCGAPTQLTSIVPTILDAVGSTPMSAALEGPSMLPALGGASVDESQPLFWEHCGNAAVRQGGWKLAREFEGEWELYNMRIDPTETQDLADRYPDAVVELAGLWQVWADRVGVIPFGDIVSDFESRGLSRNDAER